MVVDMEAFKAANPGCVLGDFIRWHSPKDWDENKGEMSARMADAGNYWQELWNVRHHIATDMVLEGVDQTSLRVHADRHLLFC